MIYAFAFALACAGILAAALGHGPVALLLAICATIAFAGGWMEERGSRHRRDAWRRNHRR